MKNIRLSYTLFILGMLLTACGKTQAELPATGEGEIANWGAWRFTWKTARTYFDVTVQAEDKQKTYFPEPEGSVFLAATTEIVNISNETQEIRFPQGPIYLMDENQNKYDLVGIAKEDTILMSPPYLLVDKTLFTTFKWDTGFITLAFQPAEGTWFIQSTPGALFYVDFLFVIPENISKLVLHFGNGMIVNIQ